MLYAPQLSLIRFLRRAVFPLLLVAPAAALATGTVGWWSAPVTWPNKTVHVHLLPTGKVFLWDSFAKGGEGQIWDPIADTLTPVQTAGVNVFCAGHAFLPDGRLALAGEHITSYLGGPAALTFDPFTKSWLRLPDMAGGGRWYPTNQSLPNGDVVVVSGSIDTAQGNNPLPEVFEIATGTWRPLTNALLNIPFYPSLHLAPNGMIFMSSPLRTTRYLDVSGTGKWIVGPTLNGGMRENAGTVMYAPGKLLIAGGSACLTSCGTDPYKTAEIIDLNSTAPAWSYTGEMAFPRKHHNTTVLPDGTVLVTGGSAGLEGTDATEIPNPVYAAELWNPVTGAWTTLASAAKVRTYHSAALLLPDGRVLTGGGEAGGPNIEIFSPPYLSKGPRPILTSAPASIQYGQSFTVETPDPAAISRVTLIGFGSVTHSLNLTQSFTSLSFTPMAGGLSVTAPVNSVHAQQGYYLLFVLDAAGVPSVGKIVRLNIPGSGAAPAGLAAIASGSSTVNLTWTDTASTETAYVIELSPDNVYFAQAASAPANSMSTTVTHLTPDTLYFFRIRAYADGSYSEYSNTASATTKSVSIAAPSGLSATANSSTKIGLFWQDNSNNETGFAVEGSPDDANYTRIATTQAGATQYTASGLASATRYFFRVRAVGASGFSEYSNGATATTLPMVPTAPSGLQATAASASSINLTWVDNSTNEVGFKIERSTNNINFAQIAMVTASVTSFTNTGLTSGIVYYYRVRGYNTGGNGAYSNAANTSIGGAINAPSSLAATANSSSRIGLTWTDNSADESGFAIERSPNNATFTQVATVGANVRTYTSTGNASATAYYFRVRAFGTSGQSLYSNVASATTLPTPPAAPSNLVAVAASSTSIRLTWTDNSSNETGFKIERSTNNINFAQIVTVAADVTSFTNTGLTTDTVYYYRVRGYNSGGNGAYSNVASGSGARSALLRFPPER